MSLRFFQLLTTSSRILGNEKARRGHICPALTPTAATFFFSCGRMDQQRRLADERVGSGSSCTFACACLLFYAAVNAPYLPFVSWLPRFSACLSESPVIASPTKKNRTADYSDKPTTGSTSTSVFFLSAMFCNSAITPASLLIRKSSTLRFTLWCSHDSVAKREQFSCPLGTTSLLLKLENVVPGRWMFFLLLWPNIFFTAMSSTRTYVYFSKNLVPGM